MMQALQSGWDFFQNEVLGMKWLNRLIGSAVEACGLALWGAKTCKRDPTRKMRIG